MRVNGKLSMKSLLSIRMRASRRKNGKETHISGAEGIFSEGDFPRIARQYVRRAMTHPRGRPDRVVLTVERITVRPRRIEALPVATLRSRSPREAATLIAEALRQMGVSTRAAVAAMRIITSPDALRGASLMDSSTGRRREPDRLRGVRASRIGISREAARQLGRKLSRLKINTTTVKEALVLASKVAACGAVVAELCVSDDPDYTTGYVASRTLGYLRIPHIKKKGSRRGGRVFFIEGCADVEDVVAFLEKTPVMVTAVSSCRGAGTLDEIIGLHNR